MIPKSVSTHSEDSPSAQKGLENHQTEKTEERTEPKPIILPKPKHVRPKIITYIRRSPQALGQVDTSLVPVGLPYAPPTCTTPLPKEEKVAGGDLKPAGSLYEKFRPDLQKPRVFSPGLMVSGIKPPGHHFSQISEKFLQEVRSDTIYKLNTLNLVMYFQLIVKTEYSPLLILMDILVQK